MRICPICNERDDIKVFYNVSFKFPDSQRVPPTLAILRCSNCGFVYTDSPGQAWLDDYYSKHFYASVSKAGRLRWHDMASIIANSPYIRKDMAVLDIGSDDGYLEGLLTERGFTNVKTLDPALEADFKGTIFRNDIDELFDLIILSHVIEHIADLRGAVREFEKLLKPGGKIFIEVPTPDRYYDFDFNELSMDFSLRHINCFNEKYLDLLFAGWDKLDSGDKKFDVSPYCTCPCTWVIYTRESSYEQGMTMFRYWHEKELARARKWIKDIGKPVILWAFADLASLIIADTDIEIAEIVDSVMAGYTVDGMVIKTWPTTDNPIVIISTRHAEAIKKQIKEKGLKNEVYEYRPEGA